MNVLHRDSNGVVSESTDRLSRNTHFTLDSKGNPTKVTRPDLTTRLFEYNTNSQATKQADELSRVTTWTYDSGGNLTQIKQPDPDGGGPLSSPITTMVYDSQGRMTSVTDARNNTTTLTYDSRDRVTEITNPDSTRVTFTYDSASNVETRKDERGNTTTMTYDGMDRLRTVTTPDRDGAGGLPAPVTTLTYDAAGNNTVVTRPDPDGTGSLTSPVSTFTYNSMNRAVTAVDALLNTTTFTYDNAGNVVAVTDPLSRTTTFTYNELGYRTSTKTPLGNITTFSYDAEGQVTSVQDPVGRTTFTYSNRGLVATTINPLSQTTTFGYDSSGNRTSTTDAMSFMVGYQYDNLDRAIQYTDQLLNKTTFTYDAVGNRTSVKDPLSHVTTFVYDSRNRQTSVTDALSNTTTNTYDAAGNLTVVTDPLSRSTTFAYDAANRRTSITQPDPDGGGSLTSPITTFSYDNLDRLLSLKDPVNNVTSWTYSAIDQVLTEIDPLSKTATYTYDAAGQLTRIIDRKGQRRDFAYDSDGRRTQEYWCPAGSGAATGCGTGTPTRIFTYSYDGGNRLTEVNETDSRYTFTYDNAGRVTGISSLGSNMPQVRLTNTWDAAGRRTAVSDNLATSGTLSFTYDAASQMTNAKMTVGGTVGPNVTISYDAAHRLTSISRQDGTSPMPNLTLTTLTYDNADRLTAITHTYSPFMGGPTTLATYTYAYNAASELTVETNKDGTLTYTYDNTSQLAGVDGSGGTCGATGCDETFSYDVNGNRTMSGYTTGTGNRLTSDGTYNYTFDDNGNTLTKTRISDSQKTEFTWDFRNRLTQVVVKDSSNNILQQSDYTYDAFDRRIIKSFDDDGPGPHSAAVTKTLYDGVSFAANPYADFNGSNTLTMRYLYGPEVDLILARRDASGTVAWYLGDHLGTVRDLVNTSGTVLDHISYSAFGKVTAETSPSNGDRFKSTGRERDTATGLDYFRARTYDSAPGRFLSQDPIAFLAGDSNLFRYVGNTPGNGTDPSGLDWLDDYADWFNGTLGTTTINQAIGNAIHAGLNAIGLSDQTIAHSSATTLATATAVVVTVVVVGVYFGAPVLASGISYAGTAVYAYGTAYLPSGVQTALSLAAALVGLSTPGNIGPPASAAGACFVSGTAVETSHGSIPIEEICAGTWVLAANADSLLQRGLAAAVASDDTDEQELAFDWFYVWLGVGVLVATCVIVHRTKRKRAESAAFDDALEMMSGVDCEPDNDPNKLSNDIFSSSVDPMLNGSEAGVSANELDACSFVRVDPPRVDKRACVRSAGAGQEAGCQAVSKAPRAKRVFNTAQCFALASTILLAILSGWSVWGGGASLAREGNFGPPVGSAPPLSGPVPADEAVCDRVLYYTFSEPTGEAAGSWLLPETSQVALADGSARAVIELETGEKIVLAHDVIGTVERVSDSFIPRAPPTVSKLTTGTQYRQVVGTVKHTTDTVLDLRYHGETLTTTPNHPFWVDDKGDWVLAGELCVGDVLCTSDGSTIPIESVEIRRGHFTVYNLEVEGAHNYFAGNGRVLVHNGPPGNPCAMPPQPPEIFRGGGRNPGALTPRPQDGGMLSARDSLSNPWPIPAGQRPPLPAGDPIQVIDTSRLPPGTVIRDGVPYGPLPVGHVSIGPNVPASTVQGAIIRTIRGSETE